ncbi:MAG: glutamate--tRNA ligase [Acidobacteriota bacterium]
MTEVRTRFAPSPTGYIHVGNVRAALFPYLLAKQQGGKFILRIEDTDQARFVEGAEDLILDTLEWLGIDWDEGPRKGGDFGPYIQSERRDMYKKWAQKLVDKGLAYADPYSPEQVQGFREEAIANKEPFLYRNHRPEMPPVWDGSQPLRFKVTNIKRYEWHDPIMGDLSAGPEVLDDFILIKADGLPTYNFAHIVDDSEMGVTHVIRGLEYISSIPRYLSLYEALGLDVPVLACMPHIMAPDGKKKLGKRDGAKSVTDYRTDGILPEAMLNFLASMGWNDGTEQEIFSKDELIEKFSLERVQRSGARFDEQRLLWMNGYWIRSLTLDDLSGRTVNYWPEEARTASTDMKQQILRLVQDRLKTLAELPMMTRYFFSQPTVRSELITSNKQLKKLSADERTALLKQAYDTLAALGSWDSDAVQQTLNHLLETTGQKPGVLFSLIRIVTTWAPFSPQLSDTLALLGRDTTLARIAQAIELRV